MTMPPLKWSLSAIIIAILALGFLIRGCQRPADPAVKIPAATQRTMDSLTITAPPFSHTQDSLRRVVVYDTVQATQHQALAQRAQASAKAQQHRADSLAVVAATALDSGAAWHRAYDARTREADTLRTAIGETQLALAREQDARRTLAVAYGADTLRRRVIEGVNEDLRRAIERLERPCRIVGPIPCPSRTVTAVAAAIGGAVAGSAARR